MLLHKVSKIIAERERVNFHKSITTECRCIQFPKIVHLMYFPWERTSGILKANENDFNHDFYYKFQNQNPEWEIRLWTLSKIKEFVKDNYSIYENIWSKIKHPTQAVDFFRLLVTYHFGGIYWQYDSIQKMSLEMFIPSEDKTCRLFVESIISNFFSLLMKTERIRQNKPEELIRISNQCFSANPKNDFLIYCIEKSWNNLQNLIVKNQYDILYIGANAMISEAYDEYLEKKNIQLNYNTSKYIKLSSNGSMADE